MKTKFFRYSGTKFNYVDLINQYLKTDKGIYCEPFVDSGQVLFNLPIKYREQFKEYIINDSCRNIVRIYKTFKEITYNDYLEITNDVKKNFGSFKAPRAQKEETEKAKQNYYNFRNWFNEKHWRTETLKEGVYLHILQNSCINSFLRFGPSGMNQSFGNREEYLQEHVFNSVKETLKKTTILNKCALEVIKDFDDQFFFLDPPYQSQDSSYSAFSFEDLQNFLDVIRGEEFLYTDILNEVNQGHSQIKDSVIIREMCSTSPNTTMKPKNGNIETLFSSYELVTSLDDW